MEKNKNMSDMNGYLEEYKKKAGWWRLICKHCQFKWFGAWSLQTKEISGSVKPCEICGAKNPTMMVKIPDEQKEEVKHEKKPPKEYIIPVKVI